MSLFLAGAAPGKSRPEDRDQPEGYGQARGRRRSSQSRPGRVPTAGPPPRRRHCPDLSPQRSACARTIRRHVFTIRIPAESLSTYWTPDLPPCGRLLPPAEPAGPTSDFRG